MERNKTDFQGRIIPFEGKICIYGLFMKKTGSSLQSKKICSEL
jgi:hypothetical protein